jgi:hypothetical protein
MVGGRSVGLDFETRGVIQYALAALAEFLLELAADLGHGRLVGGRERNA